MSAREDLQFEKGDTAFSVFENADPSSKLLFTIGADGTITKGPAFTTTDAMSLKFWEAVSNMSPLIAEALEFIRERRC
jgi:hypothetical protein